jgi:hypothetical protein
MVSGGLVAVDCGRDASGRAATWRPMVWRWRCAIVFVRPERMRPDRNGGNAVA